MSWSKIQEQRCRSHKQSVRRPVSTPTLSDDQRDQERNRSARGVLPAWLLMCPTVCIGATTGVSSQFSMPSCNGNRAQGWTRMWRRMVPLGRKCTGRRQAPQPHGRKSFHDIRQSEVPCWLDVPSLFLCALRARLPTWSSMRRALTKTAMAQTRTSSHLVLTIRVPTTTGPRARSCNLRNMLAVIALNRPAVSFCEARASARRTARSLGKHTS